MEKKGISLILAIVMLLTVMPIAMAEETAITEITFNQDFENYTPESSQNSIIEIGDTEDKAFSLKRTDISVDNTEKIVLDTAINQDIVELEFKVLPRATGGEKAEAYIQLMQGASNARLNVKISCDNGSLDKYRVKVGNKEVISTDALYHLPKNAQDDGENFTEENFNKIKMIMHRVIVNETADKDLSKFYVYLNDEPVGTYTFTEIGTGGIGYTEGKAVESVRMYQYRFDEGKPLDEVIYFDDIVVRSKSIVEYIPAELTMNFEAAMNYAEAAPMIVISSGTDSLFLEQTYSLSLINAEDDSDITPLSETVAVKADGSTATFDFSEEVNVEPGWYYADVQRYIDGEIKGSGKQQKIYVATAGQLEALPGDFSELPEEDEEAQSLIMYYLPCFLTEEEINVLLPEENDMLTQQALDNLTFLTAYFKNSSVDYISIPEVQADFLKAKGYLELKNAQTSEEVFTVLEKGGYLTEYTENDVFNDNKEAFFSHFETKRTDNENLLISDEKVQSALRYSMAMTSINTAERSGIEEIVEKFNDDVFRLDLTAVTVDNADSLYPVLYNKSYVTVEKIRADWEAAVANLPEKPQTPPELDEDDFTSGSGSSGGGSSSGGSGSSGGGSSGGGGGGGSAYKKEDNQELAPEIEPVGQVQESQTINKLTDISGHWAEEAISALCENGVITGFEDNTFRPEGTLTRAEFVVMLGRILPDPENENETDFVDVEDTDWFSSEVKKAVSYGIIQGTDGKFMPHNSITREQLAVIIYRALKTESALEEASFADYSEVSDYARDAVSSLSSLGILSGYEDNTIRPKNHTSRAEAAKLLYGLLGELAQK